MMVGQSPMMRDLLARYVEATTLEVNEDLYRSMSSRRALEEKLALELGERIAKLFYEHETKELGGNLR